MAERLCPHGHEIPESEKFCPQCGLMPTTPDDPPRQYPRTSMFGVPPEPRDDDEIRHWWRIRRIHYNLILILAGLASVFTYFYIVSISPQLPMEDTDWPGLFICMGGVFLLVGANIMYTLGWVGEMIARRISESAARYFGPLAFGLGMLLSIGVVFLPAISIGAASLESRGTAPVTRSEVVGQYKFEEGLGIGNLTIRPDGTYEESFTINDARMDSREFRAGKTFNNSGNWTCHTGASQGERPKITLANSFDYFWFAGLDLRDEMPWSNNHDYQARRIDGRIVLDDLIGNDAVGFVTFSKVADLQQEATPTPARSADQTKKAREILNAAKQSGKEIKTYHSLSTQHWQFADEENQRTVDEDVVLPDQVRSTATEGGTEKHLTKSVQHTVTIGDDHYADNTGNWVKSSVSFTAENLKFNAGLTDIPDQAIENGYLLADEIADGLPLYHVRAEWLGDRQQGEDFTEVEYWVDKSTHWVRKARFASGYWLSQTGGEEEYTVMTVEETFSKINEPITIEPPI